jgi:hypothetical protein
MRVFGPTGMHLSLLGPVAGAVGRLTRGDPFDQERTLARLPSCPSPPIGSGYKTAAASMLLKISHFSETRASTRSAIVGS